MTAFRDEINAHIDAGTCWLCKKPVIPFTDKHGATGAHWDCTEKLTKEFEGPKPSGEYREAVAKGGSQVHIIDTGDFKPLCGYKQANTAWRMKKRSGWYWYTVNPDRPTEGPHAVRHCSGCTAAFNKMQDDEL